MKVYVTYGIGTNLNGCYSVVEGDNYDGCLAKIREATQLKYAFDYSEEEGPKLVDKYNLRQVPLQPHRVVEADDGEEMFF